MPAEGRKVAAGYTSVGGTGGTGGGCAIAFGFPFMAAGLGMLAVGLGAFGTFEGPLIVMVAMGCVFFAAGFFVSYQGISSILALKAAARRQAEHPGEPWYVDHAWDPSGATHGGIKGLIGGFLGLLFFAGFLTPFNWWAWFSNDGVLPVKIIVSLFDLILLACVFAWVYEVLRRTKYGVSVLRFGTFPFFLGEPLTVYLQGASRIAGYTKLTATLRCVEEVTERKTSTDSNGRTTTTQTTVGYIVWEEARTFAPGEVKLPEAGKARLLQLWRPKDELSEWRLEFDVPQGDGARPSQLLNDDNKYVWQLVISAETPGLDYDATFLLPVYAR